MIPDAPPQSSRHIKFAVLFTALVGLYFLWLVACWPGVLGQDSLAIMLEIETQREFQAGKPAFWYLYAADSKVKCNTCQPVRSADDNHLLALSPAQA